MSDGPEGMHREAFIVTSTASHRTNQPVRIQSGATRTYTMLLSVEAVAQLMEQSRSREV